MQIIHIDTDKKTSTCYYYQNNVIHSIEVDNYCFREFFDDRLAPMPFEADLSYWQPYLAVNPGEPDTNVIDYLLDNPHLLFKFSPYMNEGEIKELNHYLHVA